MNKNNVLLFFFAAFLIGIIFFIFTDNNPSQKTDPEIIRYSEFLQIIENNQVRDVAIGGRKITAISREGRRFISYAPNVQSVDQLVSLLKEKKIPFAGNPVKDDSLTLLGVLIGWLPIIFILCLLFYFMKKMQGKAFGLGKSKAKLLIQEKDQVTFEDVAGIDEAKQELEEIIEFLKNPHKFQRLGGKVPRGVLLVGPPGTGKTLLARAVAGEANVPFFQTSGSDFVEMFVGVGASRVRNMFAEAKENAPCIVFVDELDAVGRHRGAGLGGGNDEREQTLNQLLVEMDGFDTNEGVILVAATNRPDILDPALLRPGRFDRRVIISNPDILGREAILNVHGRNKPMATDIDYRDIARGTPGFSGADLANLLNEAALLAARKGNNVITANEINKARDKILLGTERKIVIVEEEREIVAYHEAGHALVCVYVPGNDSLHRVTIIPRTNSVGGVTLSLPDVDRYCHKKQEIEAKLAMLFGGRAAEEILLSKENFTAGASSDIQQATMTARAMITEWGMSEKLGTVRLEESEAEIFLGRSVTQRKNISEKTARLIDEEIKKIINTALCKAREVLTEHKDELCILAKALLEYETLDGEQVNRILKGELLGPLEEEIPKKESHFSGSVPTSGTWKKRGNCDAQDKQ